MVSAVLTFLFFCGRPNVIVATSPQFFCGWAGVVASWLKWCPLVLEIRDIWPESIVTVDALQRGVVVRTLEWLERLMYRSANHIVAVGNGYRDNIIAKIGRADRISVVTNGVDAELFTPREEAPDFRETHGLNNKFVCSYVGTIGMAHALDVVVRAAKSLRELQRGDICFCLVGDGASKNKIEALIAKEELQNWVKMTGRLPKSMMPDVLASSNCLLIHLKKTDLFQTVIPSKIFESMAMQRPLIMGVKGESADIVETGNCGIHIEPENEQQLVEAVTRLCDTPSLYDQLSAQGRKFVVKNYSRDTLADRMLAVIESVAKGTRSS